MRSLLWVIVSICLATFVVETAFAYVSTAKRLLESGVKLPFDMRCTAYFWLIIGLPADFVFNVLRGSIIFRERPHELLFTSRVKRHLRSGPGWRRDKAYLWAEILNAIDPNHVH